jgi:hypothetical protein
MKINTANGWRPIKLFGFFGSYFLLFVFSRTSMAKSEDHDPCAKISIYMHSGKTDAPKNLRFDCYQRQAVAKKENSLCKKFSGADMADCFSAVAVAKDDLEGCMQIPVTLGDADYRPRWKCLSEIARQRKDPSLCDKIPHDFLYLLKHCRGEE